LQLIDRNSQHLQTLYCTSTPLRGDPIWSPDSKMAAFSDANNVLHVVNLTTGGPGGQFANINALPYAWPLIEPGSDSHHLYLSYIDGSDMMTAKQQLFVIDPFQSPETQKPQLVASGLAICASFAMTDTQLLSGSCTPSTAVNNCRSFGFQGPGSLNTQNINGGPTKSLYSGSNLATLAVQPAASLSILFYRQATTGDNGQDGLWSIGYDGKNLTRLIPGNGQPCVNLESPALLPHILGGYGPYALLSEGQGSQSIQIGNMNIHGGPITTIVTRLNLDGILVLVGQF
jgi:hypothetical protein